MMRSTGALAVLTLLLSGCWSYKIYPVTSAASYAPATARYLVWSKASAASGGVEKRLLELGYTVVERTRLDEVFEEQRIRLMHSPEDEANILRIGRITGATQVIFVDVFLAESGYDFLGHPYLTKLVQVSLRGVDVETAQIRWRADARTPEGVRPETALPTLGYMAMARAACPDGHGYTWTEITEANQRPCQAAGKSGTAPVVQGTGKADREIWGEMQQMEQAEYQRLTAEKQALDKRRAEVVADTDLQRLGPKQQVLAEYSQRLAEYEKRVAAHNQRVATYNQRQAAAAGQPR